MQLAAKMIIHRARNRAIRASVVKLPNEKRESEILLATVIKSVI